MDPPLGWLPRACRPGTPAALCDLAGGVAGSELACGFWCRYLASDGARGRRDAWPARPGRARSPVKARMAGRNPELVVAAVTGRAHAASRGARLQAAGAARRGTAGRDPQPGLHSRRRAPASLPLRSCPGRHHGGPPPRPAPRGKLSFCRRRRAATTRPGLLASAPPSRGTAPVQGARQAATDQPAIKTGAALRPADGIVTDVAVALIGRWVRPGLVRSGTVGTAKPPGAVDA